MKQFCFIRNVVSSHDFSISLKFSGSKFQQLFQLFCKWILECSNCSRVHFKKSLHPPRTLCCPSTFLFYYRRRICLPSSISPVLRMSPSTPFPLWYGYPSFDPRQTTVRTWRNGHSNDSLNLFIHFRFFDWIVWAFDHFHILFVLLNGPSASLLIELCELIQIYVESTWSVTIQFAKASLISIHWAFYIQLFFWNIGSF